MRTTTILVAVLSSLFLLAGYLQSRHAKRVVSQELRWQASRSMESATKIIDSRMRNIEVAVQTASNYAKDIAQDADKAPKLLESLVASSNDITAATLLYKANYFPQHGRYFAPTVVHDMVHDTLIHYEIGGKKANFMYLETDSNWVYSNRLNAPYWSLPFIAISTKSAMVSYSVPLHDKNGEIFAVLCASIDLRWVQTVVDDAKPYSYAKVSILSRDGRFISHPDTNCILSVSAIDIAKKQGGEKAVEITKRMLQWLTGVDTMKAPLIDDNQDSDTLSSARKKSEDLIIYYAPIERVKWSVSYTLPESKIMAQPNRLANNMRRMIFALIFITAIIMYTIIRAQMWPLKQLLRSARKVAKGDFSTELPKIKSHDEIRRLRDSFEHMQHSLTDYINQLQETSASKASIERDLTIASGIQMAMLPKDFPPFPDRNDIDVYGNLVPAKQVGGDLFDYYIRDEKLFFCIGDVSGKGIAASLVMAVTRTLVRTLSAHEAYPDRIMNALNETMTTDNKANMFVTLFIGVLDLPTGRLRYCNAGHNAPMLVGKHKGFLPVDANVPVGVMPEWQFNMQETMIDPDTVIFLYTDGLTEAENTTHGQFGEKRMIEQIESSEKPKVILDRMTNAVKEFVGEADQSDDLTMLAIKYTRKKINIKTQRSITLINDVNDVPKLAEFVDELCEELGIDMADAMQLNLAMEEAVVNVMNYAYPTGTKGDINIEAVANDERLRFVIIDSGTPFDPTAKEAANVNLALEDRPIGGLGIHLVRQIMDSINYERIDGKNVLTLRKKLTN